MILRPARSDDALDVLAWRNDPLTRAMSRNEGAVEELAHLAWFARALANPALTLLIGEDEGRKVGMVRFDHGAQTEVSINVAPEERGRGYGQALLAQGVAAVGGVVFAEIKPENEASLRLFESVGFRQIGDRDGRRLYRRDP